MSGNSISNSAVKVWTALLFCDWSSDACGLVVLQKKLLSTAANLESGRMRLWFFNYNDVDIRLRKTTQRSQWRRQTWAYKTNWTEIFMPILGAKRMPLENFRRSGVACSCVSVVCMIRPLEQFWHEVKAAKQTMHWRVFSLVYIGQLQRLLWTNSKIVTPHKIFSRNSKGDTVHNIMLITSCKWTYNVAWFGVAYN